MKEDECFWESITEQWKDYCERHMIVKHVDRADDMAVEEEREKDDTMDGQISLPDDPVDFNDDLDDNSGEGGDGSD